MQGFFLILLHITVSTKRKLLKSINIINNNKILIFVESVITFAIVISSWIFFKSENIEAAVNYISGIFSMSFFTIPELNRKTILILIHITLFFIVEWLGRNKEFAIYNIEANLSKYYRWAFYIFITALIIRNNSGQQQFIYFQF